MLHQLTDNSGPWDVIVTGGGATGLGVAVDAASRGFRTLLLEAHDFAQGTSSRSTKLIHGGIRYLQRGDVSMVLESLRERGLLMQNAPHLVHNQSFIVPNYDWWEGPLYGIGLRVYDKLAGNLGLGPSRNLSPEETRKLLPTLSSKDLKGGVIYYDGQFDDARLAVSLARTAASHGGVLLNYMKVTGLLKSGDMVEGVTAEDRLTGVRHEIRGRVVINATGVFTDRLRKMDDPHAESLISPSRGIHLVVDRAFLPGNTAIMVPQTDDRRVLFAVPWWGKVLIGTTDTPVDQPEAEPLASDEEIDYVLEHAGRYLTGHPGRSDVCSVFAGLRPLVRAHSGSSTATLSRDHVLMTSQSGLLTITGGKWTTYRKMAEETVDQAAAIAGYAAGSCRTEHLRIHGWMESVDTTDPLHVYGSDGEAIRKLASERLELGQQLHERLPFLRAEVIWAVRHEMAQTLEDVLARRLRALVLDARASVETAPEAAHLMAKELGRDNRWQQEQVDRFTALAALYHL